MRIYVSAKPNSKENKVEKISEDHFRVYVSEPPVKGRANYAIIRLLSEYFAVPPGGVRIFRGHLTREKIIDIFL
ncbi:MAG: hypothetical protein A3B96_04340 [Candidatus Spechtbacteria bacterium RIFCSPHIGHO2_02_FULL_43_15b]|nr:MAG: hypothetical protein A3B96_04340 [Candidatus Spechtbacteria bacterium RIFCSPHIGHO2_02_FULL_43_15b]